MSRQRQRWIERWEKGLREQLWVLLRNGWTANGAFRRWYSWMLHSPANTSLAPFSLFPTSLSNSLSPFSLSLSFWFIHLPLSQCPLTLPCNILNCKNPLNPMVSIRECSRVYVFISAYASASLSFCSEFVWVTGRKQGNNSAEWRFYRQFKAINSFDYCSHLAWQCPSLAFTICN